MKSFKRWTAAILSSVDHVAAQIENHEALVDNAIREVQENSGRARAQLARVRRDGEQIRKRLVEQRELGELWKERAKKSAEVDEKRALECLRRAKRIERELGELEVQERTHVKLQDQLSKDQSVIEDRLLKLKQQRNLLRTRQTRAEAFKLMQNDDSQIISEIDDILDRWDFKVSQYEYQGGCCLDAADDLEHQFDSEEEDDDLRMALVELLHEPKAS